MLIPLHKPGAVSVCLSSQVGCAMGCVFCATARMTRRRNLATWEIIDQLVQARDLARVAGPAGHRGGLHGDGRAVPELRPRCSPPPSCLRCPYGGSIAAKAITISTVGLVPEIDRYTAEGHSTAWPISLGAATDAKRARLVPVAARTPVAEVMAAARRHALARRDRVMLAYVCISGENVGEDDARALGELIGDTPVRLDLIDVTDPTGRFRPPTPEELQAFRDALTPPRRPAGRPPLLGGQGHPGRLRDAGGAGSRRGRPVAMNADRVVLRWTRRASSCRSAARSSMTVREVGAQARLARRPRLGMGERLEDATAVPDRAFDDALVDQEQEDRRLPLERDPRPVFRAAEVVLEAKAEVAGRLLEERPDVLIVAMRSVVSQPSGPGLGDLGLQ